MRSSLAPSPIVFCFDLGSSFAQLYLLLLRTTKEKKTHTKKPLARDIEKSHARVARERRRGSKVQGTRDVGCLEIFIPGSCK